MTQKWIRSVDDICRHIKWMSSTNEKFIIKAIIKPHSLHVVKGMRNKSQYKHIVLRKTANPQVFHLSVDNVYPLNKDNFAEICAAFAKITKTIAMGNVMFDFYPEGVMFGSLQFVSFFQDGREEIQFNANIRILELMSNIHCHVSNLFLPLNFKFIGQHKWNVLSVQDLWINVTDFAFYANLKYEKFDYKFYNQHENYRNFATTAQIMNISNIIHFDFSVEVSDMKCLFTYIDIMLNTPCYFRHLRLADEVFGRLVLAITYGLFFTTNEQLDMLHLHNYLADEYAILRRLEQKNYIECNCRQVRNPKCQHFSTNHLASKGENIARNRYLLEEVKRASVEEVKILDKKFEDKLKGRLSNYKYCNTCYSVHEGEHVVSWPYFLIGHPLHDPRLFYLIHCFSGVIPTWSSVNKNEIFDRIVLYEELLQN